MNKNFLFESQNLNLEIFFYVHLIDNTITAIMIKNKSDKFIKISRNNRFKILIEVFYLNAFHVEKSEFQKYVKRKSTRIHKFA